VGKVRSKNSASFQNVIPLGQFRLRRTAAEHSVFYLTANERWLDLLSSCFATKVESVRGPDVLKAKLLRREPDLVLVESGIRWADPVDTIHHLHTLLEVPIVMICDARCGRNSRLIKRAFAAGVCDTLFTPLKHDELVESLDVLLKYQRHVSSHH
jgi:DNA-binding response OmpR family regulator